MNKKDIREFVEEICKVKEDVVSLNNEELGIYKMAFYKYKPEYGERALDIIWDYIWDYIPKQEMYRRLRLRWENGNNKQEN